MMSLRGVHSAIMQSSVRHHTCRQVTAAGVCLLPTQPSIGGTQRHMHHGTYGICGNLCRQPGRLQMPLAAAGNGQTDENKMDLARSITSAGLLALWIAFVGYAFTLAPNQTPFRDQLYLEKLVGLSSSEGVNINPVFFYLFNIMGVYPALYAAILTPSAKSSNKVPSAPFLVASFFTGMFALLPYFALWSPLQEEEQKLPRKDELGIFGKALESPVTAAVLTAASVFLLGGALTAGGTAWIQYLSLFDESRFAHITTLDFCLLTAFMPFWLSNDAAFRNWKYKDQAIFLAFIPVLGPALYLLLRPKAE